MGQLGQSITVINKSGVIVKNSKQVLNVFKEAKEAYQEKKAELRHAREQEDDERRVRKALNRMNLDEHDRASRASSKASKKPSRHHSHAHHHRHRKPDEDSYYDRPVPRRSSTDHLPRERGYTDSAAIDAARQSTHSHKHHQISRRPVSRTRSPTPPTQDPQFQASELRRRHTDPDPTLALSRLRSRSLSPDMDLAYGEFPPALPPRPKSVDNETQLRSKMTLLTRMLEEAHCLQHSATATIEHLQKNPDALAAVALTLAEISNLVRRMAPGALGSLAKAFPAAVALLTSPQVLIATGLGVGGVAVALGGYKIVKRIQDRRALEKEERLLEVPAGLDRIEMWRRGIADVEAESVGTTVDGEFITPEAERRLIEEGKIAPGELKAPEEGASEKGKKRKTKRVSKTGQSSSTRGSEGKRSGTKRKIVAKGVKMLFKGRSTQA